MGTLLKHHFKSSLSLNRQLFTPELGQHTQRLILMCQGLSVHTEGSREMILTVLSTSPTARKRERCSPGGTLARLIHTTSADISFRSVYSFSWPDYREERGRRQREKLYYYADLVLVLNVYFIHI